MSRPKRRMDNKLVATTLGWASVRKKDLTTTPHLRVPPPSPPPRGGGFGRRWNNGAKCSVLTQLTGLGLVHETRIVAQLNVTAVALDCAVRIADANDVNAAGILAEETVLEAEIADKVHFVLDLGAARVVAGGFRSPEHGRGPQLGFVLVERGIRALGHRSHRLVGLWTTL